MSSGRPSIPKPLELALKEEAGYRCAVPTCKAPQVTIDHIDDWAKVKEHRFLNMIALCPNCHDLKTRGLIDRRSLRNYKAKLIELSGRYSDFELRFLRELAKFQLAFDQGLELGFEAVADGRRIQIGCLHWAGTLPNTIRFSCLRMLDDGLMAIVEWDATNDVYCLTNDGCKYARDLGVEPLHVWPPPFGPGRQRGYFLMSIFAGVACDELQCEHKRS